MTIKYNVAGAKTRNGKEIAPMAFGDWTEAERFAKYHEGLSVPQNLRKHPGNIAVVVLGTTVTGAHAAAEYPAVSVEGLSLHAQQVGRVERKSPPVTIVVDPKVFMAGVEEHTGPVQVLKLPKEIVCELTDPLDKELTDKVAARVLTYDPSKAISLADMQARYAQPLERTATVGNADLEEAYAMGYRLAVANSFWKGCTDEDVETQDYVDQRRSDLKELVSYDRSL